MHTRWGFRSKSCCELTGRRSISPFSPTTSEEPISLHWRNTLPNQNDRPVADCSSQGRCELPRGNCYNAQHESTCLGNAEAYGARSTRTNDSTRAQQSGIRADLGCAPGQILRSEPEWLES